MITYVYWALVFAAVFGVVWLFGRMDKWKGALIGGSIILLIGWVSYYFYLQQAFVKRWGGVMSISVPEGQLHITATWKDEHLWIENYDPQTNKCIFSEYSKGNVLEGRVTIKNCNPIIPGVPNLPSVPQPQPQPQ